MRGLKWQDSLAANRARRPEGSVGHVNRLGAFEAILEDKRTLKAVTLKQFLNSKS